MEQSTKLTVEQLSGDQYDLAELVGIAVYKRLVMVYGGSFIYICKADTVMKVVRNREICRRFNGYNHRELAIEYNLSEKTIRDITADRRYCGHSIFFKADYSRA